LLNLKTELIKMLSKVEFEIKLLEKIVLTPHYKHITYLIKDK